MAYDFVIKADVPEYQFSFAESMHEWIFSRDYVMSGRFPLFYRMADYYQDCVYGHQELEALIKELNLLIGYFSSDEDAANILCELKLSCKKGIEQQRSLTGFAD